MPCVFGVSIRAAAAGDHGVARLVVGTVDAAVVADARARFSALADRRGDVYAGLQGH